MVSAAFAVSVVFFGSASVSVAFLTGFVSFLTAEDGVVVDFGFSSVFVYLNIELNLLENDDFFLVGDCAADGVTGLLDVESVAAVATGLLAVDAVVSAALVAVESSAALAVFFSGSVV